MRSDSSSTVLSSLARVLGFLILGGLIVGCCLHDSAVAQPSRPTLEMMRKIGEKCPDHEIFELLNHPPICGELGLGEDVCDSLRERNKKAFGRLRSLDIKDRDEQIEKIAEILNENCSVTRELLTNEQFERLIGLFVQARKHGAAANIRVAERIGLKEQELEDFRNQLETIMFKGMKVFGEKAREIYRNPAIPEKQSEIEKLRDQHFGELDEKVKYLLSSAQLEKLNQLKGAEFEELPPMFGSRGRRGGGRSRDRDKRQDDQYNEMNQGKNGESKKQNRRDDRHCCSEKTHAGMRCLPASM